MKPELLLVLDRVSNVLDIYVARELMGVIYNVTGLKKGGNGAYYVSRKGEFITTLWNVAEVREQWDGDMTNEHL